MCIRFNFTIMESRYTTLCQSLEVLKKTGVPLLIEGDTGVKPFLGDDLGSYYFILKLSEFFNISIDLSVFLFYGGLIAISLILGIIGFYLLFKKPICRDITLLGLFLLTLVSFNIWDVYVAFFFASVSIVPLFLYFSKNKSMSNYFFVLIFFSGIVISLANYIRSHSGTSVFVFITFIILFNERILFKRKCLLLIILIIGFLIPFLFSSSILKSRDNYLRKINPTYQLQATRHTFWHTIYCGLGFLNNKYGIEWLDEYAFNKAHSKSPQVTPYSKEYENIIKKEVLNLIKKDFFFIIETIFAKLGVILFYVLIFANFGLLARFFYPQKWYIELAFILAFGFNLLFGILAIPRPECLLGLFSFSTLYGIMSINKAIEDRFSV